MLKKITNFIVAIALMASLLMSTSIVSLAASVSELIDEMQSVTVATVIIDTDTEIDSDVVTSGTDKTITIKNGATLTINAGGSLTLTSGVTLSIENGALVDNNSAGSRVWEMAEFAGAIVLTQGSEIYAGQDVYVGDYKRNPDAPFALRIGILKMTAEKWSVSEESVSYVNAEFDIQMETEKNPAIGNDGFCKLFTSENGSNTNAASPMEPSKNYWWMNAFMADVPSWVHFSFYDVEDPMYQLSLLSWATAIGTHSDLSDVFDSTWVEGVTGTKYKEKYNTEREVFNEFNLYIPADAPKDKYVGVILFIHGGGWTSGDEDGLEEYCARYAREGYITATIDHRLAGEEGGAGNLLDMLDDITECIAAIKEKVNSLGYKTNKMALYGGSSGGHLAMLYAYSRPQDSAIPITMLFQETGPSDFHEPLMGFTWTDEGAMSVIASMCVGQEITQQMFENGQAEDLINSISPVAYVTKDIVPSILGYCGMDTVCVPEQRDSILAKMEAVGATYHFVDYAGSDHTLELNKLQHIEFWETSTSWLSVYLAHEDDIEQGENNPAETDPAEPSNPATGSSSPVVFVVLALLSGAVLLVLCRKKLVLESK